MTRALAALVCCTVACTPGPERDAPPRGEGNVESPTPPKLHPLPGIAQPPAGGHVKLVRSAPEPPRTITEPGPPPPPPPPPERDLPGELRAVVGDPVSCLTDEDRTGPPGRIDIAATAIVTRNGIVSRASVTAALSAAALECLERRVGDAHFADPVEAAPRTIRATVTIERSAPEPPPEPAGEQVPGVGTAPGY